jgi:hypothetical protein
MPVVEGTSGKRRDTIVKFLGEIPSETLRVTMIFRGYHRLQNILGKEIKRVKRGIPKAVYPPRKLQRNMPMKT